MSSVSAVVYLLDSDNEDSDKNRSISELISTLRTAYRSKDFDRIEEILITRESKLQRELQNMKKDNAFLSEQCDVEKRGRNRLEEELNKQKGESEELKRLIVLEKAAQDAAQVGERKAVERYEKLLEEVKTGKRDESVISELRKKCCVLECAKVKAQSEVELWKRRFEELGIRVSKLEEDTAMLMDLGSKKCDNNGSSSYKEEKCSSGKGTNTVHMSIQDDGWLDCDENTSVATGAGLNFRSPSPTKTDVDLQCAASLTSASRAVVDILDSDDDHSPGETLRRKACRELTDKVRSRMLKRKRTSFINDVSENMYGSIPTVEGNIFPTGTRDMKEQEELIHDTDGCPANRCSATAVSSGCKNVDKVTSDSSCSSTDSDDEFVSQRITKLQREQKFNKFDALRGTTFVEFLVDGNPQGNPKKSVLELEKMIIKGFLTVKD